MFTYYVINGSNQQLIFCAGYNPSTNVFEFYQSNNGGDWEKQTISPTGQDGYKTYYKITRKNSNTTITLQEDTTENDLYCLLINKDTGEVNNFTLTPIHRDKLPQNLILVEDLLAKAPSKKPTYISYENDSQEEDLSSSFFMTIVDYAYNKPWEALACSLLVTALITGAVFLTIGSCGIAMGLLSAAAVLGIGSALMASSSIGLAFVELWSAMEKNQQEMESRLVI